MTNLKSLREGKKVKQKTIADTLGMSERQYRRIEQGTCSPDIRTAIRIANELGVYDLRTLWNY